MSNEVSVSKIVLNIKGQSIELTTAEAKQLQRELDSVFGAISIININPKPHGDWTYPIPWSNPPVIYGTGTPFETPFKITCSKQELVGSNRYQ